MLLIFFLNFDKIFVSEEKSELEWQWCYNRHTCDKETETWGESTYFFIELVYSIHYIYIIYSETGYAQMFRSWVSTKNKLKVFIYDLNFANEIDNHANVQGIQSKQSLKMRNFC